MLNGIAKTTMVGRTQIVSEKPLTMLDVGHNPHAFENLLKIVNDTYPYKQKIFILGVLKRKNLMAILSTIKDAAVTVYAADLPTPEAFKAKYMVAVGNLVGIKNMLAARSVKAAYALAKKANKNKDVIIIVAGSFHTVGEFLKK